MADRIKDINPNCQVNTYKCFYLPENKDDFDFSQYDYIVDAVDTVTAKIQLVMEAKEKNVPIISSMGAGCLKWQIFIRHLCVHLQRL